VLETAHRLLLHAIGERLNQRRLSQPSGRLDAVQAPEVVIETCFVKVREIGQILGQPFRLGLR
jgi:hypothetical protein